LWERRLEMAKVFKLPELAESVVEGEIVRWIKREGDEVKKNEPLLEVMTEKVNVEIPSPFEGILYKILAPEGSVVPVNDPIAVFLEPGEDEKKIDLEKLVGKKAEVESKVEAKPEVPPLKEPTKKVRATPAARKLARELGIDIEKVPPSGSGGRVEKQDVLRYSEMLKVVKPEGEERIPLRGIRREIAVKLRESKDKAVHTLHVDEADMTELVKLRERLVEVAGREGVKLTFMPFIVKAVIQALRRHPHFNATYVDEKGEVVIHRTYNIGIATATDQGLIVPVIHRAEEKTLLELAKEIARKAELARRGELKLEDVTGGTFSITNIGSIGGILSFPVINYPQVAILGVHSIKKSPVFKDGEIVVRDMTYLSLSFDHRVVDGAQAALFTKDLIKILENPESLLLELK
jgi:pyruvate dehydrogenase E2 component (dihydrolipoamide acetyltransferase)